MNTNQEPLPALAVTPRSAVRLKLPPGWEKCKTGMRHVRKWRNMETGCWVTDREDDPKWLYCGIAWEPLALARATNSTQEAIDRIHAMTSPNAAGEPRPPANP